MNRFLGLYVWNGMKPQTGEVCSKKKTVFKHHFKILITTLINVGFKKIYLD